MGVFSSPVLGYSVEFLYTIISSETQQTSLWKHKSTVHKWRQHVPILCILNCQLSQPGIFAKTNPSSYFLSIWQTDSKDYREPLTQGLVKYSPWAQSSPPVVFVNKVNQVKFSIKKLKKDKAKNFTTTLKSVTYNVSKTFFLCSAVSCLKATVSFLSFRAHIHIFIKNC